MTTIPKEKSFFGTICSWFSSTRYCIIKSDFKLNIVKKQCIEAANRDLQIFNRELNDVNMNLNLQIDVSGLLTVFDFLFDGFIADMMLQSKLNKAKEAVNRAIPQVQNALNRLKAYQ